MKRKLRIDNLIEGDLIHILGRDWVSNAMDSHKYENKLVSIKIDDPINFEIEFEINKCNLSILLRVSQKFHIPVEMEMVLENDTTYIELNRLADQIY